MSNGWNLVGAFFNFIGGTIRWVYGTIWRLIVKKPRFTFQEYIYGHNYPNYYDMMGHQLNNKIIGALVFVFIIVPILQKWL